MSGTVRRSTRAEKPSAKCFRMGERPKESKINGLSQRHRNRMRKWSNDWTRPEKGITGRENITRFVRSYRSIWNHHRLHEQMGSKLLHNVLGILTQRKMNSLLQRWDQLS
jgi:hypothetical protein